MEQAVPRLENSLPSILTMFLVSGKEVRFSSIALILVPLLLPLFFGLVKKLWGKTREKIKKDQIYEIKVYSHQNPNISGYVQYGKACPLYDALSFYLSKNLPEKALTSTYTDSASASADNLRLGTVLDATYDFVYEGITFKITRNSESIKDSIQSNFSTNKVFSYTLQGTKRETLVAFLSFVKREYDRETRIDTYDWYELHDSYRGTRAKTWPKQPIVIKKKYSNLFWPSLAKKRLMETVEIFLRSESEYARMGLPYKLGFLFHGLPGTGKTAAIYALANELERSVYCMNKNCLTHPDTLLSLIRSIPPLSIIVIEDIDAVLATNPY